MRLVMGLAAAALTASNPGALGAQQWNQEIVYDQDHALRPGATVDIDVADSDVRIETSGTRPGHVTLTLGAHDLAWGRTIYERMAFDISEVNGGLRIVSRAVRITREDRRRHHGFNVTVHVTVPRTTNVRVTTGDGDVLVGDLEGTIDVRTADGDVDLGIVTGPRIEIHTSDGDVRTRALTAPTIRVRSNDGDIYLQSVRGGLEAETNDGDITVTLLETTGVSLRTGDGDVFIDTPFAMGANVELAGEDVTLSPEFNIRGLIRDNQIRGELNGGGPRLYVRTGDGHIRLRGR